MFEADPLLIAQVASDTSHALLQAGPPADLPAQVPDFVSKLLDQVGASANGLGETVSNITPGGSGAESGLSQAADHAGPK